MRLGLATALKHRAKLVRRRVVALPGPCVAPELSPAKSARLFGLGSKTGLVHWPWLLLGSNGKAEFGFVAAGLERVDDLPPQNEFPPLNDLLLQWLGKAVPALG